MADGLTRREQWAVLGLIAFIGAGLGISRWRDAPGDKNNLVTIEGQGHWRKLTEFDARDAAAEQAGVGQRLSALPATLTSGSLPMTSMIPALPGGTVPAAIALSPTAAQAPRAENSPSTHATAPALLDINAADARTFEKLPGIGPAKAQAIVATRIRLGGFQFIDQLDQVPGIGAKTLERLRPLLTCSAEVAVTSVTAQVAQAASVPVASLATSPGARAQPRTAAPATKRVNINSAGASELVGSSRVDLQACKLEYSIVSPK